MFLVFLFTLNLITIVLSYCAFGLTYLGFFIFMQFVFGYIIYLENKAKN
jgi:hypothetical protein